MGNVIHQHSEQSDSSDEGTVKFPKSILAKKINMVDLETDALATKPQDLPKVTILTSQQCSMIQDRLDAYEKVSLIFLLSSDNKYALELMQQVSDRPPVHVQFIKFLLSFAYAQNETMKLVEALSVIQNYSILKALGYHKAQLVEAFAPHSSTVAITIDKSRKMLYSIAEKCTKDMQFEFVQSIANELQTTSRVVLPRFDYLEMYFSYLLHHKFVSMENFQLISKHLKPLDLSYEAELLNSLHSKRCLENSNVSEAPVSLNTDKAVEGDDNAAIGRSVLRNSRLSDCNVYPMDDSNPGIVLIMENLAFYEEHDPQFKRQVIETETALEEREGSEIDSKRLIGVFKRFGYRIIHERNRTHSQMLDIMHDVAHYQFTAQQSSFVLIFLSHGLHNQIIGCNSVPIHTDDIKNVINSKVLENKPKIVIYQACQGTKVQTIPVDITTDGPTKSTFSNQPSQMHMIEMWPTIPGYVSFRSKSKGTWMIQSFCDNLELHSQESITDIMTRVNSDIGKRQWLGRECGKDVCKVMVSNCNSTLQKKFFFPTLRPLQYN